MSDSLPSAEVNASAVEPGSDGIVEASPEERSGSKRTREARKRKEAFMFEPFAGTMATEAVVQIRYVLLL